MQVEADRHWTWQQFLGWAFGEARRAELAAAVHDAALRARYLCDVPADHCVGAELIKNLVAISRQAEHLQLDSAAAVARRAARALRAPSGAGVLDQVREAGDALERGLTAPAVREAA